MRESRVVKIWRREEEDRCYLMEHFGWELISRQADEYQVELLFSRDTDMPNYYRIRELENAFGELYDSRPKKPSKFSFLLFLFLLCLYAVPGIIYAAVVISKHSRYKKAYAEWDKRIDNEGMAILCEAESLL